MEFNDFQNKLPNELDEHQTEKKGRMYWWWAWPWITLKKEKENKCK